MRRVSGGVGRLYAETHWNLRLWEFCVTVFVANETKYGHETGFGVGVGPLWIEAGLLAPTDNESAGEEL